MHMHAEDGVRLALYHPHMSLIVQKEQEQQKTYCTFVNARACQNSGAINGVHHFIV